MATLRVFYVVPR